jgi:putative membrane protein
VLVMGGLWQAWTWEPLVALGIGVVAAWYWAGLRRLWRHAGMGRSAGRGHAWFFAGGLLAIVLALMSPLDTLAEALFAAHMAQHMILVVVAAPLLVLGRPLLPLVWALPAPWRRRLGRWWAARPTARDGLRLIMLPSVVFVAHAAALGYWHVPRAYGWAYDHEWVHAIEHASFLITAGLFWWVVLQPTGRRRLGWGAAILYVTAFAAAAGTFAAVLTFARAPWYAQHFARTAAWGLTPLEDQQLAGLIMWIPAGVAYLAAASYCFIRWVDADARAGRMRPADRITRTREPPYAVSPIVS